MKKLRRRILGILSSLCLLAANAPALSVPAGPASEQMPPSGVVSDGVSLKEISPEAAVLSPVREEDTALRGEYEKHFVREDGSYVAVSYSEPVHYLENGQWKEIDNTLIEATVNGTRRLATRDGLADVSFSKTAGGQLARIEQGGHTLSWSVSAAAAPELSPSPSARASAPSQARLYNLNPQIQARVEPLTETAEAQDEFVRLTARNAASQVVYENVLDTGVDIRYTVSPTRVKEDILLHSPKDIASYIITLQAPGLSAVQLEDGTVVFRDSREEEVFRILPVYMYDAADGYSEDIQAILAGEDGQYTLTLIPDQDWLRDEERVYPITIDPSYQTSTTRQLIQDVSVCSATPGSTGNDNQDRLYIGYRNNGRNYALIKHSGGMPFVNGLITSAYEYLRLYNGTSSAQNASAFLIARDWSSDSVTFNQASAAGFASTLLQSDISHNNLSGYTINMTEAVRLWYKGQNSQEGTNQNHGILVRYTNDYSTSDYNSVYSSDHGTEGYRPKLTINYLAFTSVPDGTYCIRSRETGGYLDVYGGSTANSANVNRYTYNASAAQRWTIAYDSGNYYKLTPGHASGMALDIDNAADGYGTNVQIYSSNNTNAQRFAFVKTGSAYYIVPKTSRTCVLDGGGAYFDTGYGTGHNVRLDLYSGATKQHWYLEKMGAYTSFVYPTYSLSNNLDVKCYPFAMYLPNTELYIDNYAYSDSVSAARDKVLKQFPQYGKSAPLNRRVRSISKDEYINTAVEVRIAMKVDLNKSQGYHFMIQCSDGTWNHKLGGLNSVNLGYINPDTIWNYGGINPTNGQYMSNTFNSETVYFAVSCIDRCTLNPL